MRPLVVPLMLLPWASLALAEPLPAFLDSRDYERRLPAANVPVDTYRPVAPDLQKVHPVTSVEPLPLEAHVVLRKVRFEGGTVYPLSELRDHFHPLIGQEVTVAELQQFTERLTQRYQRDGYLLSHAYLPPQDFAEGRIRVVLVEGYIRDYRVVGDVGPADAYLGQLMARLRDVRPLTREMLNRYVGLAQRIPGFTVQAEVVSAEQADGASQLTVHAWRKPFDAAVTLGDGSRDPLQALFKVSSNAQTRVGERVSASLLLPPGDEQTHYQRLDYSQYLDAQGSQLLLSAARYRSEPRTRVRMQHGIDISQRLESERFSIGLGQPLTVAPNEWMAVTGHFYSVSQHTRDRSSGVEDDTYVRALSFEGDWRKAEGGRLQVVSAGVYQGLDYLSARSDADYDMDFLRVRVAGLQSDRLFGRWQGVVSAALYWSDDRLPESERAVFGGQQFGRGYPRDQAAGDKGWGVAYELNYSVRPVGGFKVLQPYAVLDAAQAWYNGGPFEDARMSSLALGMRFGDGRAMSASVELAKPLSDVAMDSLSHGPRVVLSFTYQP